MFSPLRNRLGVPGILAVIALVFSMAGGAYAAKKYIITSTSQIKPSVLKKLRGPAGPAGAPGATGAVGAKGADGTNGTNGTNGSPGTPGEDGKSVVTGSEATGTGNCEGRGGAWVEVEGSGVKRYVCNGENGGSGEAMMTGDWSFSDKEVLGTMFSISYPQKLSGLVNYDAENFIGPEEDPTTACPGSFSNPEAEPGNLCLYAQKVEAAGEGTDHHPFGYNAYTSDPFSGATFEFAIESGAEGYGFGSWAVTPPATP
jgi:hypothetical protein